MQVEKTVLGLGLVGIGALWTMGNLGRIDLLATLRTWWPLWLVAWGLLELAGSFAHRPEKA
jgi:hypothetical protein